MGCGSECSRKSRPRVKRMTYRDKEGDCSQQCNRGMRRSRQARGGLCSDENSAPQLVSRRPCTVTTGQCQRSYSTQQTCLAFIEAEVSKIWDPKHHTELVITPHGVRKSCPKTSLSSPIKNNPRYMIRHQLILCVTHHK